MLRISALLAAAVAVLAPASAPALMVAFSPPGQRALTADAVVVGTVTAIEEKPVEAKMPGGGAAVQYSVAVVKIDTGLIGVAGVTHLKVGFVPAPVADAAPPAVLPGGPGGKPRLIRPIPRRGNPVPDLKAGQSMVFFLNKHPTAGFYLMPPMSPPVPAEGDAAKAEIANLKKVAAVVADPAKALKAEAPADRYFAASTLVMKYRAYPAFGGEVEQKPISADESKLILKGLAEGDWSKTDGDGMSGGMAAVSQLGLTPKDGWKFPQVKPGQDLPKAYQAAFAKWVDGPGKDYQIKQTVVKAKK